MSAQKTSKAASGKKNTGKSAATAKKAAAPEKTSTKKSTIAPAQNTAPVQDVRQESSKAQSGAAQADTAPSTTALTNSAMTPPAKATPVAPAVKVEAQAPAVKEKASPPAVKEASPAPAVREQASPPAVQEQAASPAVQETPAPAKAAEILAPKAKTSAQLHPLTELGRNPYLPYVATVMEVIEETHNIKTFRVTLDDTDAMRRMTFQPGQVGQLSVFGVGEATFVINSPPSQKHYLQFSVMRAGEVTEALHRVSPGDKIGVRAPLGNAFPVEQWKGKDVFFVGGGIGMAPIRTVMLHVLEHRQDYGNIGLLYGARSPRDMAFSYELDGWLRHKDLHCTLTIDAPFDGWVHKVGLIPNVLLELAPKPESTVAVICGPPIMIKFTVEALKKLGFADENIITTLERRMKCGIGICGRCNIGNKYVCVDGPVFSWAELKTLPPEL